MWCTAPSNFCIIFFFGLNLQLNLRWFSFHLLISCGGGRWPVDGLCQQPCSHQPTARVGYSIGFCRHFDFITVDKAETRRRIPTYGNEISSRTSTSTWCTTDYYCMMDEHLIIGTGFNTRTTTAGLSTTMDLDLYSRSLGGEDEKEDNVVALEVHQHGGEV